MTAPAIFTSAAMRDLKEAAAWIARNNFDAAIASRDATIQAAPMLGKFPSMGARRPFHGADRFRFHGLRRFPYLLVYNAETTPPRIVRVLHMARDLRPILESVPD